MVIYVIPGFALDKHKEKKVPTATRRRAQCFFLLPFLIYFYWIFGLRKYEIGYFSFK